MTDYVIPIVWPMYAIASGEQQFTGVGHAGIIVVDGETGFTRYFEFGRYARDSEGNAIGEVHSRSVANLLIGSDGIIDRDSLEIMLNNLSNAAGQGTVAQGTIIALSDGGFEDAVAFAEAAMADEMTVLGEYNLNDNHCYSFARAVATAGGSYLDWFDGLWVFDNIPTNAMLNLQTHYGGFSFRGAITDYLFGSAARHVSRDSECFPAGTPITLADETTKPIEDIAPADTVLSHDTNGNLTTGHVTQLLPSITTEWLVLSNGTTVTPGHRFLRPDGSFMEIADIIALDGQIVEQDGTVITVTAERVIYSDATAHLYEQGEQMMYARPAEVEAEDAAKAA